MDKYVEPAPAEESIPLNRAQRRAAKKGKRSTGEIAFEKYKSEMYRAAALMSQLAVCRGYGAGPVLGDVSGVHELAEKNLAQSIGNVRSAYSRLADGSSDSPQDLMILVEAFGVSVVRAIDIAGERTEGNPLLQYLHEATTVTHAIADRFERWGKWQVTHAECEALHAAIDCYVEIISNSTPAQMETAMNARTRLVAEAKKQRARKSK